MKKARLRHPLTRFRLPLVLLAVIIVYGVAGYMLIDRWNLLDSFYVVIITIRATALNRAVSNTAVTSPI